jgi:xylulokinase
MAASDLLLGVDIGTSSSKGVLVRPDGTLVASTQRPHELSPNPSGGPTSWRSREN